VRGGVFGNNGNNGKKIYIDNDGKVSRISIRSMQHAILRTPGHPRMPVVPPEYRFQKVQ
jgi:hypothetical protein